MVEHKLMVVDNRTVRILGPERDEVTGGWRKLHELHNLCCQPNIRVIKSKRMEWLRHVAHEGDEKCIHIN
jgi:hypothetical protein